MATKERFDVTASSLGSYFGVGFNTPEMQLLFDLGIEENTFTEEAEDRMMLGTTLENSVLDYFESFMEISITERNAGMVYAFDGRLKCKIDGFTVVDGEPMVVECKVSNAQKKFTADKGYYLQCQAYMEAMQVDACLLMGLWHGKPIYTVIRKDPEVIKLIEEMVDFLYACFAGIISPEDFPYHLVAAYTKEKPLEPVELEDSDVALLEELEELKRSVKSTTSRIEEIEKYFKQMSDFKFDHERFTATLSTQRRDGGIDIDLIKVDYPMLDETKYKKPDSEYNVLRITPKKKPK